MTARAAARGARGTGPKHAPRLPFALVVTGLVLGGMALLLTLNTVSAANELRRHDLAVRDEAVAAQVEQLRNEVAASAAPLALAGAAAALGMVPAGNPAFLVHTDGRFVVRGKPLPAPYPAVPLPTTSKPAPKKAGKAARAGKTTPAGTTTPAGKTTPASTSTPARRPSHHRAGRPARHPKRAARTPSSTPTPTPTPTVTLPGGPR